MASLKLAKSIAYAMAEDIRKARYRILRKADPNETYELMVLMDDLKEVGDQSWLESLSNRFERGQHYIGKHMEIEDPDEAQEIANEMAADLREMKQRRAEFMQAEVTIERLRNAEKLVAKYGVKLNLADRLQTSAEVSPN